MPQNHLKMSKHHQALLTVWMAIAARREGSVLVVCREPYHQLPIGKSALGLMATTIMIEQYPGIGGQKSCEVFKKNVKCNWQMHFLIALLLHLKAELELNVVSDVWWMKLSFWAGSWQKTNYALPRRCLKTNMLERSEPFVNFWLHGMGSQQLVLCTIMHQSCVRSKLDYGSSRLDNGSIRTSLIITKLRIECGAVRLSWSLLNVAHIEFTGCMVGKTRVPLSLVCIKIGYPS